VTTNNLTPSATKTVHSSGRAEERVGRETVRQPRGRHVDSARRRSQRLPVDRHVRRVPVRRAETLRGPDAARRGHVFRRRRPPDVPARDRKPEAGRQLRGGVERVHRVRVRKRHERHATHAVVE